ncbi:MAG TPA: hypothetical protein VER04_04635 [Polyangiaceae bacterium]|nr:hypothetical protein [Polyangiaceae bacterium]
MPTSNFSAPNRISLCVSANLRRWRLCRSASVAAICWARLAAAYRPFDGTDADVAHPGEVELEIGPAGYRQAGPSRFIVAPAVVANYGFAPRFEAVLEGRQDIQLKAAQHPWQVQGVAFSIKTLLKRGSLQKETGLSIALEMGALLPGFESRLGAHVASIFSLQSPAFTLHLNLANDIFYSVRYKASTSLILEGPDRWLLRPVSEILVEREFGQGAFSDGLAESMLIGGIARWTAAVSFDAGGRFARANGRHEEEIRAGLTWSFEP